MPAVAPYRKINYIPVAGTYSDADIISRIQKFLCIHFCIHSGFRCCSCVVFLYWYPRFSPATGDFPAAVFASEYVSHPVSLYVHISRVLFCFRKYFLVEGQLEGHKRTPGKWPSMSQLSISTSCPHICICMVLSICLPDCFFVLVKEKCSCISRS